MRHSVFWKIIIVLLLITTLAESVVMFALYQYTYNHAVQDATEKIKFAASSAALAYEYYDPDMLDDFKESGGYLSVVCRGLGITYLYVIEPDVEHMDEIYLATGWGENASEEFINNRYTGYVAEGKLKEEQIRALNGETEVLLHEKNQYDDTMICYTPIKRYYSTSEKKYVDKTKNIVCAEISLSRIMESFNTRFTHTALIILGVSVLIVVLTGVLLYFRVSKPLRRISKRMKGFVSRQGDFFEPLPVKGRDEIAEMSDSFNSMAEEIDRFLMRMSELNRQKAELNIARTIQRGLLEPQEYRGGDVSVTACMLTAKDVGGDLYDYHVLADGSVFVAIADVSGKGVTAALFMSRAITMLNQYAQLGYSPAKILYEYNNRLVGHNPNRMFITTFVAVFNPQTGELVYSNGGHNPPYILSDAPVMLDQRGGAAAGVFPNVQYREYTVQLRPGDRLFMFTDGVTEAQDREGGFFGEERLEAVLRSHADSDAAGLVNAVKDAINDFSNGAEQADDITMLALQVNSGNCSDEG